MTGKSVDAQKPGLGDAVSKLAAMDSEQLLQTMRQKENNGNKPMAPDPVPAGKRGARKRVKSLKLAEAEASEAEFLAQQPPQKKAAKAHVRVDAPAEVPTDAPEPQAAVPLFKPVEADKAPGDASTAPAAPPPEGPAAEPKETLEVPVAQNLTAGTPVPLPSLDAVPAPGGEVNVKTEGEETPNPPSGKKEKGPKLSNRPPQPLQVAINGTAPLIPFPTTATTPLPSGLAPDQNAESLLEKHRLQSRGQAAIASAAAEGVPAAGEGTPGAVPAALDGMQHAQAEAQYAAVHAAMEMHETATKYTGVRRNKGGRYSARIKISGTNKYLGSFKTAEEAARAFDAKAVESGRPVETLNFPAAYGGPTVGQAYRKRKVHRLYGDPQNHINVLLQKLADVDRSNPGILRLTMQTLGVPDARFREDNKYAGIRKQSSHWETRIRYKDKLYSMGFYASVEAAALAWDITAASLRRCRKLNFPEISFADLEQQLDALKMVIAQTPGNEQIAQLPRPQLPRMIGAADELAMDQALAPPHADDSVEGGALIPAMPELPGDPEPSMNDVGMSQQPEDPGQSMDGGIPAPAPPEGHGGVPVPAPDAGEDMDVDMPAEEPAVLPPAPPEDEDAAAHSVPGEAEVPHAPLSEPGELGALPPPVGEPQDVPEAPAMDDSAAVPADMQAHALPEEQTAAAAEQAAPAVHEEAAGAEQAAPAMHEPAAPDMHEPAAPTMHEPAAALPEPAAEPEAGSGTAMEAAATDAA